MILCPLECTEKLGFPRNGFAIFAQFFLRTFALFLRMKRNEFCAIFLRNLRAKPGNTAVATNTVFDLIMTSNDLNDLQK